jgi:hypothetical protein
MIVEVPYLREAIFCGTLSSGRKVCLRRLDIVSIKECADNRNVMVVDRAGYNYQLVAITYAQALDEIFGVRPSASGDENVEKG